MTGGATASVGVLRPCCHLKDFRRAATRHDKLARNYASRAALAAVLAFWC